MADQDDFTFEEEENDSGEWSEEEKPEKRGGSRTRLLLLLLLLVVAGGAAYFFLMMPADDAGPAAPPQQVVKLKKKPIAMPTKPATSKPAPLPVKKAEVPEQKEAPVAKQGTGQPPAPLEAEKPAPVAEAAPVVNEEQLADEPVKVAEKMPTTPAAKPEAEATLFESEPAELQPADTVTGSPYSLTAGTYLLPSSVKAVSRKIRALGYEPQVVKVKGDVTMTRLKVGTYARAEAAARVAELKPVAPGAFSIRKGDMATVYAGSFLVVDRARFFADKLYRQGVRLEEEPVKVEKELQRVVYGGFSTAAEAKDAARLSAAKGVDAQVLKNR